MDIRIDVESLTLGQMEFMEEYSGLTKTQLIDQIGSGDIDTKAIVALVACQLEPDDPASAIDTVRALKITETNIV